MTGPLVPCAECGKPTDTFAASTAYEVQGWEKQRPQGGTNHVLFRRRTGRVMCGGCTHLLRATGNAAQESLL